MKKILALLSCVFIVFFIYIVTRDNKTLYFKIADCNNNEIDNKVIKYLDNKDKLEKYILYRNMNNYRVIDLINDINNNREITYKGKNYTINNLLVKSELIVLNIGHNDIMYYSIKDVDMYSYINGLVKDIDKLFLLIREKSKENIVFLFDYELEKEYYDYFYTKLSIICKKYNIELKSTNKLLNYVKDIY